MDLLSVLKEKNAKYLKLINDAKNTENNLSKKFNDTLQEINKTKDFYEAKIKHVTESLNEKIDEVMNKSADYVEDITRSSKKKKSLIYENEEQRKKEVKSRYQEKLAELETTHTKNQKMFELLYARQLKDNDEDYQEQLFIYNNSLQVSKELAIMRSNEFNKALDEQNKMSHEVRVKIEKEVQNYYDKLMESFLFPKKDKNFSDVKKKIIELVHQYYEILNHIERLKENYTTADAESRATVVKKHEIDDRYREEKEKIESNHRQLLKEESEKYENEKKKILNLQSRDLDNGISIKDVQNQIDTELLEKTAESNRNSEKLIARLKNEAGQNIAKLQSEKNEKLSLLSKEKEKIEAQLRDTKKCNENVINAFLEKTKQEIDALLEFPCDYSVSLKDSLIETDNLPEQICIGKYATRIDSCELSKVLYGSKQIGYNNPILLDVRNNGNILIRASMSDETNEVLYRTVCGLTMKYLTDFPLGSLKVHFVDVNQHVWFDKFTNPFLCQTDQKCKQLVTNDSKIYSRMEYINNNDCKDIMRKTIDEIHDLFDLYKKDKTHAFHLFVLRSGFSDIVESGNIECLRLLKNLIGERGTKCGVRFIIVDDYKQSERTDVKKKQLLDEILNKVTIFDFDGKNLFLNDSIIDTSYISESDAEYFIEKQCTIMAKTLASRQGAKVLYEDIGFGRMTVENKYSSVLSIPVGKFGTKILEVPFNCGDEKYGPSNAGYIAMGRTSSGKSSFFHSLVINGCMKYSPDDLQFWLLDFKNGGASSNYENAQIPHIKLLSKNNKIDDAYCLFNLLKAEMDRRGAVLNEVGHAFRGTNFEDLHEYNECVDKHPELGAHMSRIIVVIDEAQEMFSSLTESKDDIQKIGPLIGTIAVRGRYVGIHMVMIVQNLSMGKSYILRDNFVGNIKGKITFGVDESFLRDSGFGHEFYELKDEVKTLSQGESFVTCNNAKPDKVKMAYCAPVNFEKYFKMIRETYSTFDRNMIIIGNKASLLPTDKVTNSSDTYSQLLKVPTEKKIKNSKVYSFVFGEDAYSMKPAKFLFNSTPSCVTAIGSDTRILSSICTSLLIGADNLNNKKIFLCNGGGIKEQIFNNAIENCTSSEDCIHKYKMSEIDALVKDVYFEFLQRKKAIEDEIDEENDPIFVIINDITSISKIKNNVTYDLSNDSDSDDNNNDNDLYDSMTNNLKLEKLYETIEQRYILDIIKEICIDGASVGIYFNFSSKNSDMYVIDEIFQTTSNKLVFNDAPTDLSDPSGLNCFIKPMLSGIRNDVEMGETLVASIINGVVSKVRPILYEE